MGNDSWKNYPPWHIVEKQIKKEIDWLRNSIITFSKKESYEPKTCRECLIRNIAILIVSGKIEAKEIRKDASLKSLWNNSSNIQKEKNVYHGKEWHRKTMKKIENHFLSQKYKVVREPTLNWGRADLGAFKNNENLYIEVGTTSFFKLWVNLKTMNNFVYLIVPDDEKIIEFNK